MDKLCCVTLDDGSELDGEVSEFARSLGIPLTFFLISGRCETEEKRSKHFGIADLDVLWRWYEGHEIGSHGAQHLAMDDPFRTDVDRRAELVGSRLELKMLFGRAITSYAFPYGKTTEGCLRTISTFERIDGLGRLFVRMYQTKYPFVGDFDFAFDIDSIILNFYRDYPSMIKDRSFLLGGHVGDVHFHRGEFSMMVSDLKKDGYEFVTFSDYARRVR